MAGIDDILAGTGGNTRADFSAIGDLPKAYWEGKDQAAKNDLRDAFKGGLPMKGDQVDWPAVTQKFFSVGAVDQGISAAGQALAQQKMEYGQRSAADAFPSGQAPPPAQAPIVSPPSASAPRLKEVAAPLNKGGVQAQGGETPKSYLAKQGLQPGYNMEVALAYFKRNGIDPDQTFDPNDPRLAKLQPTMQRLGSVGQVQPPQPGDGQPQVAQAPMQPPQGQPVAQMQPPQGAPQPQMAPQMQPAQAQPDFNQRFNAARPGSDPTLGGLVPAGRTPQQQIGLLSRQIRDGMLTPEAAKVNQSHIDAITKALEPTGPMKEAAASGLTLQQHQERQGEQAAQQAGATETAKAYVIKYNNIDEAGTKAIQEIPKLEMARNLMDSPDFQSGSGQRFDLAYRRLAVRLGGDPDKAAPQEIVSKVVADSILNGLGSLKGLGPIRVAEMNLARTAAMSMDNTPQTNRFLANVSIRIQKRAVEVSDMAQNYNDGVLDVGFDKKLREMDKKNPLFTPEEVQRFQKIISGEEKQPKQGAKQGPSSSPTFGSKSDLHAAIASGKLQKGDSFIGGDGVERTVP